MLSGRLRKAVSSSRRDLFSARSTFSIPLRRHAREVGAERGDRLVALVFVAQVSIVVAHRPAPFRGQSASTAAATKSAIVGTTMNAEAGANHTHIVAVATAIVNVACSMPLTTHPASRWRTAR